MSNPKKKGDGMFHYTDADGIRAIARSDRIVQSTDVQRDCAYGKGTYMTRMTPDNDVRHIAQNNYNTESQAARSKVEYAIKVPDHHLKNVKEVSSGNRDLWVKDGGIRNIQDATVIHVPSGQKTRLATHRH